jgi:hypothetical protein
MVVGRELIGNADEYRLSKEIEVLQFESNKTYSELSSPSYRTEAPRHEGQLAKSYVISFASTHGTCGMNVTCGVSSRKLRARCCRLTTHVVASCGYGQLGRWSLVEVGRMTGWIQCNIQTQLNENSKGFRAD